MYLGSLTMTSKYRYILMECDEDGEAVEATDVTDEIVHLYTMIDYQERIISSYRREFLPGVFPEDEQLLRH